MESLTDSKEKASFSHDEHPPVLSHIQPPKWWRYRYVVLLGSTASVLNCSFPSQKMREYVAEFAGVMLLIIFGDGVVCQVVLSANEGVAPAPKGVRLSFVSVGDYLIRFVFRNTCLSVLDGQLVPIIPPLSCAQFLISVKALPWVSGSVSVSQVDTLILLFVQFFIHHFSLMEDSYFVLRSHWPWLLSAVFLGRRYLVRMVLPPSFSTFLIMWSIPSL